MVGFSSTSCSPRLVIPAHAGIQVCSAELAWIPAFAGMTEPRRSLRSQTISAQVFSKEDTKGTKFGLSPEGFRPQGGVLIVRTLRVLRAFVVSIPNGL
jgi:hypothetical protein